MLGKIMSRIDLILLSLFFTLTACAYVDNGTSSTPERVSLEELNGCYYNESYTNYKYLLDDLSCRKYCFSNDTAYYEKKTYNVTFAEDSSWIVKLSGSESDVDQAIRLEPDKNGSFYFNLEITGFRANSAKIYYGDSLVEGYWFTNDLTFRQEDGIKYLDFGDSGSDFSSEGWTLCAF